MIAFVLGLSAAWADNTTCSRDPADQSKVSSALYGMYEADQLDRSKRDPDTERHDADRLGEVRRYDGKGWICSGLDHYHAAVILMHSTKADDVAAAYEHAKLAMAGRVPQGPWAVASTFDLWRVSRGLEQNYGTAMGTLKGKPCLYPVTADFSDADRATYGIDPLAKTVTKVFEMAGIKGAEPSMRELEKRGMACKLEAWK